MQPKLKLLAQPIFNIPPIGPPSPDKINNPVLNTNLQDLLQSGGGGTAYLALMLPVIVGILFIIGVVIFFFVLIIGAIQWIASGGDKNKIQTAQSKLSSAIIGLVILFSFFAIAQLIEVFFSISILELDLTPLFIT